MIPLRTPGRTSPVLITSLNFPTAAWRLFRSLLNGPSANPPLASGGLSEGSPEQGPVKDEVPGLDVFSQPSSS